MSDTAPLLPTLLTLLAVLIFAAIHMLAPRLAFLGRVPRSRWLSLAGGVAVAYVFLHLLPDLAEHEETLNEADTRGELVYILALGGLATFYGLERVIRRARARGERPDTGGGSFWLHLGSFAAYNLLIGYLLLHREEDTTQSLILYAVAMGLHFVTNDFGLREDHEGLYDRRGRWLLSGAVLLGAILGWLVELPETAIIALSSFLAGGIVLNVLKEELPEDRDSSFLPFALGVAGYGALLLLLL
ncbi:MAG: hypothetical protein ABNH26_13095 [Celeribacter sp.]|jgi:zinc transporter ZupT